MEDVLTDRAQRVCFKVLRELTNVVLSEIIICHTECRVRVDKYDTHGNECSEEVEVLECSDDGMNDKSLELPQFSSGVRKALIENRSSEVWGQLLEELQFYYRLV